MAEERVVADQIFDGVDFTIIPSEDIDDAQDVQLREALVGKGARFVPLRDDNNEIQSFEAVTHVISTHVDFPQHMSALDDGILVVKPSWVAASLRKGKKASERQHSPDPSQFFHDVVVAMGDLPAGDQAAITGGVLALGGQYSIPLSKLTTHLVTTTMNDPKCQLILEKRLNCKIVTPHWFDDCLKLGKRISERPYLFPDPEILRSLDDEPVRPQPSTHMRGATTAHPSPTSLPVTTSPSSSPAMGRKALNAFKGKAVLISDSVNIAEHLRDTLQTLIGDSGGSIVRSVEAADIVICEYRDGTDYLSASRADKEVANLAWLFNVINRNRYTDPRTKLLHYPVPREPLPGFKNLKISISSYSGDARIYVENLVKHCGAEFTKTMKQDNTHLISARSRSEKVEAAQEWNIHIVNHLWLEESYAKCAVQTLSNPRYIYFPNRTNLSEVVGKTSLDMERVEHVFFAALPTPPSKKVAGPPPKAASRSAAVPNHNVVEGSTEQEGSSADNPSGAEENGNPSHARPKTTLPRREESSTTLSSKAADEEKENQSPMIRSASRASKVKALDVMTMQAQDIAQFQKEMKRKGGVTHGGRRSDHHEDMSSPVPAPKRKGKRTSEEMTYEATNQGSDLSDGETQAQKTHPAKKSKQTHVSQKIMVTGYERWTDKPKQCDADKAKLRSLGLMSTDDYKDVKILVAPKILRTRKFVCALACAPLVVGIQYLDSALQENRLDDDPPLLEDREAEERLGFKLSEAIARAKINARHLLRGWSIFVSKNIQGGFDTYNDIITANGGAALMYAGRKGLTLPRRRLQDDPNSGSESQHQGGEAEYDYVYLVSGDSPADVKNWKAFRELAAKQGLTARIVKSDWLLTAAMSQQITWNPSWEFHDA